MFAFPGAINVTLNNGSSCAFAMFTGNIAKVNIVAKDNSKNALFRLIISFHLFHLAVALYLEFLLI